jgi:hypothetical protein
MVPCKFSFDLPLFGLGPSSKGHRSNLWLSSYSIALFSMGLGPQLKWSLELLHIVEMCEMVPNDLKMYGKA